MRKGKDGGKKRGKVKRGRGREREKARARARRQVEMQEGKKGEKVRVVRLARWVLGEVRG